MARNTLGQYTRSLSNIEIKITKTLQNLADEAAIRIKPLIRDELEQTLRSEIYASYRPATKTGQETQEYNETHTHQKKQSYHHTGILARSIRGRIDGDTIIAGPAEGYTYENGMSAIEVYKLLKFGTAKTTKGKVYNYGKNGEKFSQYISQQPHNFETRTKDYMNDFLKNLAKDLENNPSKYNLKYKNKRI